MKAEHLPPATPLAGLSALAVLGLVKDDPAVWEPLRAHQYAALESEIRPRALFAIVAGLAIILVIVGAAPLLFIGGWVIALIVSVLWSARTDRAFTNNHRGRYDRAAINGQLISSVLLAVVWTAPLIWASVYSTLTIMLKLWAVLAMLPVLSGTVSRGSPLGTAVLAVATGIAGIVVFAIAGQHAMIVIAGLSAVAVVIAAIQGAKAFLIAQGAQHSATETREVVSLLLREFEEEGEADLRWQTDANRRISGVSSKLAHALGKSINAIDGQGLLALLAGSKWESGELDPSLNRLSDQLKSQKEFTDLIVQVNIGADQRWWKMSGKPRFSDDGTFLGFNGSGFDITAERQSSDEIARMARIDALTGLPNRMMVAEAVSDAMKDAAHWRSRCAFVMVNLDRFKAVNDTLGHQAGDRLLDQVAKRLRALLSDNEVAGRLGGDEFALVMRDSAGLNELAVKVIDRLSQPYVLDDHTFHIGASIGSAIGPRDGDTVEKLMRNADLALRRAKEEGGGQHSVYEPELHAMAEERRKLEASLRHALERNELSLLYQPVVDARSEGLVSFEALLRWNSVEHGPVSPVKFIPMAEDTRLIVPIGDWVLRQACNEAASWAAPARVAVNVSGEQLLNAGFVESVVSALAASGLPPQRLEIEVTESIFVRDQSAARRTLEEIMALGCGVALDDFGTGYSSLAYIRNLRFSTIKVDRSFVQGASSGNRESQAIIQAVVAMANALDMSTTAEGVETEAELELVRSLGCTKIQGYYYGRPMSPEDARRLFRQNTIASVPA